MQESEIELRRQYRSASDDVLLLFARRGLTRFSALSWTILCEELQARGLQPPGALSLQDGGPALQPPLSSQVAAPVFTGRGAEYFRIWIVNLLLTLVTLGLYSPWAKVRKARYFRQNTQLDGHVFDYHGNPVAILRGRLIALVLFAGYSWAFQLSRNAGLLMVVTLCVVGPWLFLRSQQFTLANTSYRGLRFGFDAGPGEAYRTVMPVLVLWLAPAVTASVAWEADWAPFAVFVGWPWMHHRLKAFQRSHATFGNLAFTFAPSRRSFYGIYAKGFALVILGSMAGGALLGALMYARHGELDEMLAMSRPAQWLLGVAVGLVIYVVAGPYYAARLQHVVWSRTRLGDIRFRTEIRARPLFGLVVKSVTLSLLTAGLYWPLAAVALARYRIECMRVESAGPLSALAGSIQAPTVSAAGEGASEFFGFDVGL